MIYLDFEKESKKAWKRKIHPSGWKKREKEAGEGTGKRRRSSIKKRKKDMEVEGRFSVGRLVCFRSDVDMNCQGTK